MINEMDNNISKNTDINLVIFSNVEKSNFRNRIIVMVAVNSHRKIELQYPDWYICQLISRPSSCGRSPTKNVPCK